MVGNSELFSCKPASVPPVLHAIQSALMEFAKTNEPQPFVAILPVPSSSRNDHRQRQQKTPARYRFAESRINQPAGQRQRADERAHAVSVRSFRPMNRLACFREFLPAVDQRRVFRHLSRHDR